MTEKGIILRDSLTVVLPCLNEATTLPYVLTEISTSLSSEFELEIIVADNGSTDDSAEIAKSYGARVVTVKDKGYGFALDSGIRSSSFDKVAFGDADGSYFFSHLSDFARVMEAENSSLVIGDRFSRSKKNGEDDGWGIHKGAMPPMNRLLGNPVLSSIARFAYRTDVRDFHCGLRLLSKQAYLDAQINPGGMEFATHMIHRFLVSGHKVSNCPTGLKPDLRNRKPHLRPWRDGWRHLKYILMSATKRFFLWPSIFATFLSLSVFVGLTLGPANIAEAQLSLGAMFLSGIGFSLGIQGLALANFRYRDSNFTQSGNSSKYLNSIYEPKNLLDSLFFCGLLLALVSGLVLFVYGVLWILGGFPMMNVETHLRILLSLGFAILCGGTMVFQSLIFNFSQD